MSNEIFGYVVSKSNKGALKMFNIDELKKSARNGNSDSQCLLGNMYLNGIGVKPNFKRGVRLLMKSSEQGHTYASYILDKMYLM